MIVTVSSGQSATSAVISGTGDLIILSGGSAERVTVSSGGLAFVNPGGLASGTVLGSGGTLILWNQGSVSRPPKASAASC
jgi:autotransporter passenger strand-loop-strand repeat protein